jgi:hypothetical protein
MNFHGTKQGPHERSNGNKLSISQSTARSLGSNRQLIQLAQFRPHLIVQMSRVLRHPYFFTAPVRPDTGHEGVARLDVGFDAITNKRIPVQIQKLLALHTIHRASDTEPGALGEKMTGHFNRRSFHEGLGSG